MGSNGSNYDIELTRGDTLDAEKVVWRWYHNGRVQTITGYSARLVAVDVDGATALDVDTSGASGERLQIATGTDGQVTPDVGAAITALLDPGAYKYDVELTSPAGAVTTIVRRATLTVLEDAAV